MGTPRLARLWPACLLIMAAGAAAAASNTLTVSATVLSKSQCKFNSASSALNFAAIDPSGSAVATASTTTTFKCVGSASQATFSISHDSGLHKTAPDAARMRHTTVTTEYLPYDLALDPVTATVPKNVNQTLTITGTVTAADYQNAYVGSYADTVVLTINP